MQHGDMTHEACIRNSAEDPPSRVIGDIGEEPAVFVDDTQSCDCSNDSPWMSQHYGDHRDPQWRFREVVSVKEIRWKHSEEAQSDSHVPENPETLRKSQNAFDLTMNSTHKLFRKILVLALQIVVNQSRDDTHKVIADVHVGRSIEVLKVFGIGFVGDEMLVPQISAIWYSITLKLFTGAYWLLTLDVATYSGEKIVIGSNLLT
jgi:hypothetical protein